MSASWLETCAMGSWSLEVKEKTTGMNLLAATPISVHLYIDHNLFLALELVPEASLLSNLVSKNLLSATKFSMPILDDKFCYLYEPEFP